jgi:protoporphyrinogen oxidase
LCLHISRFAWWLNSCLVNQVKSIEYVIIGAGPTGLGAAWRLNQIGCDDWILLESAGQAGGLATSYVDRKGFTWDVGGHVQFSHYEYFDEVMTELLGKEGWIGHVRQAWVYMRERFIPYPLQNNIHRLPPDDLNKCVQSLLRLGSSQEHRPECFGDWLEASFGSGLVEIFMRPYNSKVWGYAPELLSSRWVGERVATVDLGRILSNLIFNKDDMAWGPNSEFRFPVKGGTGAIWTECARRLPATKIRFASRVAAIDLKNKRLTTSSGDLIRYENLITTMPLRELAKLCGREDAASIAEAGLLYSSSNIIGLGLRGVVPESLSSKSWIYFPENEFPFYRATIFSNYSPAHVPDPARYWSLMLEVSESPSMPVDHEQLSSRVICGVIKAGLLERAADVISVWQHRVEYGYPTPSLARDRTLETLLPMFEEADVYSRGRFGAWKYEVSNQDHSFMQGVEVIERLLNGQMEITAVDPEFANSRWHPWPFER